ncbi:MAG: 2-succinyl-6-hydroxy-2,4-cyclohexadiene-1-carboxylate synthase [Verrucomicrobiota bacterium]
MSWRVWSHGPEDAPAIFCLHGFTGSGRDFTPLVEAWHGEPLRWIAPDLPGHGDTPGDPADSQQFAWPKVVARLEQMVEQLFNPEQPALLLGYSMGSRLGLTLTCRLPRYFSRVMLVGASPGIREEPRRAKRRETDEELAQMVESKGTEAFIKYWQRLPPIATQARIAEHYRQAMTERRLSANPQGWAAALRGYGTGQMTPIWDRLPNIRQPILIAVGEDDERFIKVAQDIFFRIPLSVEAIIPEAGHAAHMENPKAMASAMQKFLRQHTPSEESAME